MSRALSALRPPVSAALPLPKAAGWPASAQLAQLGSVLCLFRAEGGELSGWQQAVAVHACHRVDSEGVYESLCFADARGRCVWRLYLLPDSDFLAWDRLVAGLPVQAPASGDASVGERLWRRLAGSLGGQRWRVRALRLHAVEQGHGLGASATRLSPLGAATAQRIARLEGAEAAMSLDDGPGAGSAATRQPGAKHPSGFPPQPAH
ncbi:Hemin transport protein [Stenotrophomonas sp. C3(2023)]|uniref:Hemin transport protein n=1 Tax=Stenotrophomonas sp. C3(2023) TaxID=3080277 RepID=UPI00293C388E|nr:Hemin transport protein [Stenotrophomonas sp. C3(2023)]MDV3469572.1 Hemin transport protein [Stenotrophomonas sp. C3(2023)]